MKTILLLAVMLILTSCTNQMKEDHSNEINDLVFVCDSTNFANNSNIKEIFIKLCKDWKISMKHKYNIYEDSQYYYFYDCYIRKPKNNKDVINNALKIKIKDINI